MKNDGNYKRLHAHLNYLGTSHNESYDNLNVLWGG